ncbi:BTB/POZ domain-containing protein KCTD21-like [Actinia tenebrosa]|uniref:BTB/POZ domain-containing protein KCTD21-like n=1 Tax=Actinia tenebrosa TaxID=6105 RepID=A0A6P8IFM8_ACTTE|nr:BTB/POZ domain-containing protein KCTD21-like [Actinia tenebrosa]
MSSVNEKPIGLNIGGHVYFTTRSTLNRCEEHSLLRESVLGTPPTRLFAPPRAATDARGNFFFDRDGVVFRHILNYLRTGKLLLPEDFGEFDLLFQEAQFYELSKLKEEIINAAKDKGKAKNRLSHTPMSAVSETEFIGLNIGGQVYLTSLSTLNRCERGSLLYRLLTAEKDVAATDEQGNFFFDRDGVVFRHILNYLRTEMLLLPENFEEFDLLLQEAQFYGLDKLHQKLIAKSIEAMPRRIK